jgi:hypothetical protein
MKATRNMAFVRLFAIVLATVFPAPSAWAILVVDLQGTPGSSIVTISISGSGTWAVSGTTNLVSYAGGWSGDFANSDLAVDTIDPAPLLSGGLTLNNNGTNIALTSVLIDDDGAGGVDDFSLVASSGFLSIAGTAYTFSGAATFSLAQLGNPDLGSSVTFDDLSTGIFTSTTGSSTLHDAGGISLTISAVPEASPMICLSLAAVMVVLIVQLKCLPSQSFAIPER